jgi:hypothetical protein
VERNAYSRRFYRGTRRNVSSYYLQSRDIDLPLQLYSEDDKFHMAIARYSRQQGKGQLELLPYALDIQDLVVLTLLFEEKQLRMTDGSSGGLEEGIHKVILGEAMAVGGSI